MIPAPRQLVRAVQNYQRMKASWFGEGGEPVPLEQAQRRADVCARCPKNAPHSIYQLFAAPEIAHTTRQLQFKHQELKLHVEGEEKLHVCEGCWCVLALKVFVPLKHIKDTTPLAELHPACWILAELAAAPPAP